MCILVVLALGMRSAVAFRTWPAALATRLQLRATELPQVAALCSFARLLSTAALEASEKMITDFTAKDD